MGNKSSFSVVRYWQSLPIISQLIVVVALVATYFVTTAAIRFFGKFRIELIAERYVDNLAVFVPLNHGFLTALTYAVFVVLAYLASSIVSFDDTKRRRGVVFLGVFLLSYNIVLGIAMNDSKIHPITGAALKCYVLLDDNSIKYFDLVEGLDRKFDPVTGKECKPFTRSTAAELENRRRQVLPRLIPSNKRVDLFDRNLGRGVVWYYIRDDGFIELYDNTGYHPLKGAKLQEIDPQIAAQWSEQLARILDVEEAERLQLMKLKEQEQALLKEQQEEAERKKRVEDARRRANLARIAREKQIVEERQQREKAERVRIEKEQKAQEEADKIRLQNERKGFADLCDELTGNQFDLNRNSSFLSVPYDILKSHSARAVRSCREASQHFSSINRYKYQHARALQASGNTIAAEQLLAKLTYNNYPAAFDNLGWIRLRSRRYPEAVSLFQQGAKLGSAEAMFSLAALFYEGKYVEKDLKSAYYLALTAGESGHTQAQVLAENLARKVKDEEKKQERKKRIDKIIGDVVKNILR